MCLLFYLKRMNKQSKLKGEKVINSGITTSSYATLLNVTSPYFVN